jgi:hypothetical protein
MKRSVFLIMMVFAASHLFAQCTKGVDCKDGRVCVDGKWVDTSTISNAAETASAGNKPQESLHEKNVIKFDSSTGSIVLISGDTVKKVVSAETLKKLIDERINAQTHRKAMDAYKELEDRVAKEEEKNVQNPNRISVSKDINIPYTVEIASPAGLNFFFKHPYNVLMVGGLYGMSNSVMGIMAVGGLGRVKENAGGILVSGVINKFEKSAYGIIISGVYTKTDNNSGGLLVSGINAYIGDNFGGITISGFGQVVAGNMSGLMISPVFNLAYRVNGMQIGLINICDYLNGIQIGLVNVIRKGRGLPFFPVVNIAF